MTRMPANMSLPGVIRLVADDHAGPSGRRTVRHRQLLAIPQ
ncbi:hypothetical protein [Lichenicola cladoniae]|nr:hypothetical protein [Lichenicola cladoniae]